MTGDAAVALSVITYVGLIISLLCLTLFIVTYLCEKYVIYMPAKLVLCILIIQIQEATYKRTWSDSGQHELGSDWSLCLFPDWWSCHIDPNLMWHQFSPAAVFYPCLLWMDSC